jgi:hypothetical protein
MTTIFDSGSWISTVWAAGAASDSSTGMMGALQGASSKKYAPGSINSYLAGTSNTAAALASIAQTGVTNVTTLAIQAGDLAMQKHAQEKAALLAKGKTPPPPLVALDPFIYFDDGSTFDTVNNIMTMVNGKKINAVTGADWVDPASIINLANGSYLDTANNILTMPDGTKIDIVTGLIVSTTA